MGLSLFDQGLRILSIILAATVIGRIFQQRLFASPIGGLAWMLAITLARDGVVSIPAYTSHAYTLTWEWTLPPLLIAQIWACLDTMRAIAHLYRRFGNFIMRLFLICLSISMAACCLTLPFELRRVSGAEAVLRELFLSQRCVDSCIAGTLVLACVFLAHSPAPSNKPPRNLVLHTFLMSIYFGGYALLFLIENLRALGGAAIAERAQFVLIVLVYGAWAAGLSKDGTRSGPWPEIDVMLLRPVSISQKLTKEIPDP